MLIKLKRLAYITLILKALHIQANKISFTTVFRHCSYISGFVMIPNIFFSYDISDPCGLFNSHYERNYQGPQDVTVGFPATFI